jgi:type VI secretion system protein ImpL
MAILERLKNLLMAPLTKFAAIPIVLAALVVIGVRFHFFAALAHSRWLPEILAGLSIVIFIVVIVWGIPWFKEWRFMRAYEASTHPGSGESPQEFHAKFINAVRRLRQLPELAHSQDPIYALPWYLTLGSVGSGKSAELAASGLFTPHTQPSTEGGTQNCDWWISNTMVALDTAGRYTIFAEPARDRAEWYRLLRLIKHYRSREPINGIIVTISASQLLSDSGEKLRNEGGIIRERIEEAVRELGVVFPVYLLVTKCDLVEGFAEFYGAMPQRVLGDALGYTENHLQGIDSAQTVTEPIQRLQQGLNSIFERLHQMRLALLNAKLPEVLRQPIFCHLEEIRALGQPLRAFAAPLVSEDVIYHKPFFRGIFFTSAHRDGVPSSMLRGQLGVAAATSAPESKAEQAYFLRDLFATIIPRDRSLSSVASHKAA